MVHILNHKIKSFYTINPNIHKLPVVISIPHSGLYITPKMKAKLINDLILPNTDWYLSELYTTFFQEMGFTVFVNNINRYLVDVNRKIEEKKGISYKTNLIYNYTTQGKPMYKEIPDGDEIKERIEQYYLTYHNELKQAILEKQQYFEKVYLIDLHSFGLDYGSDIILGNYFGQTCSPQLMMFFKNQFLENNFKVTENIPFSGGYITKYYGIEMKNCEAIQIELWYQTYIDKRIFNNEELPLINPSLFNTTQDKMKNIFYNLKNKILTEQL